MNTTEFYKLGAQIEAMRDFVSKRNVVLEKLSTPEEIDSFMEQNHKEFQVLAAQVEAQVEKSEKESEQNMKELDYYQRLSNLGLVDIGLLQKWVVDIENNKTAIP